jgi:hypothetical protein
MSTFTDATGQPALLLAFGYNQLTDKTTRVLAMQGGRVVVRQITSAEFEAQYVKSAIPEAIAIRALESHSRTGGCDVAAQRTLLWMLNAPVWKLNLVDIQMDVQMLIQRIAARLRSSRSAP